MKVNLDKLYNDPEFVALNKQYTDNMERAHTILSYCNNKWAKSHDLMCIGDGLNRIRFVGKDFYVPDPDGLFR